MQGANSSSSENDFMTNIQIELTILVCVSCSSQFFEKLNFLVWIMNHHTKNVFKFMIIIIKMMSKLVLVK